METKAIALQSCEIKFASTEGTFTGYGSVFGVEDSHKDIVMPGAFDAVIKSGDPVHLYINHGWLRGELPVGKWEGLLEDRFGLFGESKMVMDMPSARDGYFAMKNRLVVGLSIGYELEKDGYESRPGGGRIIKNIKRLKEISIVDDPSNEFAGVTSIKTAEIMAALDEVKTVTDIERFLRDAGGFSKGLAVALVARSKAILGAGDPQAGKAEEKAIAQLAERITKIAQNPILL